MVLATINLSERFCYIHTPFCYSLTFRYETENGIYQAEEGKLKQFEKEEAIATAGSYKYLGPNGERISVVYTADENGYRPKVNVRLLPPEEARVPPALVASLVGG